MKPEADRYRRKTMLALGAAAVALSARSASAAAEIHAPIEQPSRRDDAAFIERAFDMRRLAVESGDQGYGAVVVRRGEIVGVVYPYEVEPSQAQQIDTQRQGGPERDTCEPLTAGER